MSHPREQSAGFLILIGVFKLLKAALLVALGFGIHHLMHKDAGAVFQHWAHAIRVDPQGRYLQAAIAKITGLSERKLEALSIATFCYAGLFAVEGVGLVLRKQWAEYLTVISTAGLLPIEVYEVVHRYRTAKLVLLIANVLIVAYLVVRLYKTPRERHKPDASRAA